MIRCFTIISILLLFPLLLIGCIAVGLAAVSGAMIGYSMSHRTKHQQTTNHHDCSPLQMGRYYGQVQ